MDEALVLVARRWAEWTLGVRERAVGPCLSGEAIAARLAEHDFERPRELSALTEEVADLIEQGSVHPTHPR